MKNSVLVVDDDKNIRISISEVLKRRGYFVESASSAYEALEKIKSKHFDVVVADIRMPEIDGLELLKMAKKISQDIYFIMITAYGSKDTGIEAIRLGAFDFIEKPFSSEVLEMAVKRAFLYIESKKVQKRKISYLEDEVTVIGKSLKMRKILSLVEDIALTDSTVLILGESGTGKELIARLIHKKSKRKNKPFVAINCAAIPENLLESELFGYEKGAFTGATERKIGKIELANGGTLLLDEIGDMPLFMQAKLLRVLQEKELDRLGGKYPVFVDVRIIATTNKDLKKMVEEGKFREDLYFRLNVIPIYLPPLSERKEDIKELAYYFLEKYAKANDKNIKGITEDGMQYLLSYSWPGNVRELENVIERAVVISKNEYLTKEDLFIHGSIDKGVRNFYLFEENSTLYEIEKRAILSTLEKVGGNKTKAAKILGISVRTLRNKLKEYGYK